MNTVAEQQSESRVSRAGLLKQARAMVVEDDSALLEAIVDTLELSGCEVFTATSAEQALQKLAECEVDILISDVNMRGMDGHQLLGEIKRSKPHLPVVLITAYGSIQHSVSAMQNGAADYLVKPFEPDVLTRIVERYALGRVLADQPVAEDKTSIALFDLARRVASTESTVLIAGESGTGKEVLARFIHANSTRCDAPFIAINCAAIPETMLEATLFGHEKGAFTGAHQSMPGKFEQAEGGTLLLDEISEMDLALQAKLLRVLQEREVERVGGRKTIALDVRIVATTNRELREHVANGHFREDLYYRLSVFPLTLVSLQKRRDDIAPLARYLLAQHCKKMRRTAARFSASAELALKNYAWPGNVRELDNVIQRALVLQPGMQIDAGDLMFDAASAMQVARSASSQVANAAYGDDEEMKGLLEDGLKKQEYQIILDALEVARGSRKDAAEALGVSARTLRYKMARMRELGLIA